MFLWDREREWAPQLLMAAATSSDTVLLSAPVPSFQKDKFLYWAVSDMDRGQDLGWLCGYVKALALCASWKLQATVLRISGGQRFWQCWQDFNCFFSLLLRCYFHTNTLPNPRGCIFSPGFIFSIGTSWRKGQQGSAVFSDVSAWTTGLSLEMSEENLQQDLWMWLASDNSLNNVI